MHRCRCGWFLSVLALSGSLSPLGAQVSPTGVHEPRPLPAPTAGMAVWWKEPRSDSRTGTITAVTPTGTFVVTEQVDHWTRQAGVMLDPATTPDVEVRVVHVSHRTAGGLIGMAAGGAAAVFVFASQAGSSTCAGAIDDCLDSAAGHLSLLLVAGMGFGALIGSEIGGEKTTWVSVGASSRGEKSKGVSLRPLVTWSNGPAVGINLRF